MSFVRISKLYKHSDNINNVSAGIAALAVNIWREHYTPIIGAEQVEYMLKKYQSAEQIHSDISKNDYIYFFVTCDNADELIGYSACKPEDGYMFLSKIYIKKEYRGKGLARALLNEAVALCRWEYNLDKIRLTVNKHNENSISVYKKMGFKTIDSVKTDIGNGFYMDDYVMEMIVNCAA